MTSSETHRAKRTNERAPGSSPGSAYWFIAKNENGRMEMLTIDCGGEEALLCAGARKVALDPLPKMIGDEAVVRLVNLSQSFMRNLMGGHEVLASRKAYSGRGSSRLRKV